MRERSSITPMKMKSGIASRTPLVITPKMRCGNAREKSEVENAEQASQHREGEATARRA